MNIQFTVQDFDRMEAKYPGSYWFLMAVALERVLVEKEKSDSEGKAQDKNKK